MSSSKLNDTKLPLYETTLQCLIFFTILVVGLVLRLYGIHEQGVLYIDEAAMLYRAGLLKDLLLRPETIQVDAFYVDSKILWIVILGFIQHFVQTAYDTINSLSAVFGIATIVLTYALVFRIYRNYTLALLSSFFLAISSAHVYYSRLVLPESITLFLFLAALYAYIRSMDGQKRRLVLSGILAGMAFLIARFRIGILPLFILLFELFLSKTHSKTKQPDYKRFTIFCVVFVVTICGGGPFIHFVLSKFGLHMPSYFYGLSQHVGHHQLIDINALSIFTYPYIIGRLEGWPFLTLVLTSLLFMDRKPSAKLPLILVGLQLGISSLVDEKAARSMIVVLPFLSLLAALSLYHIYKLFSDNSLKKGLSLVFSVAVVVSIFAQTCKVYGFHSDYPAAYDFIKERNAQAKVLSPNLPMAWLHSNLKVQSPENMKVGQLDQLYHQGFNYVLSDSVKYVSRFRAFQVFDMLCEPVKIFPHHSQNLVERILLESNRDLAGTHHAMKNLSKRSGEIRIYDLDQCLSH